MPEETFRIFDKVIVNANEVISIGVNTQRRIDGLVKAILQHAIFPEAYNLERKPKKKEQKRKYQTYYQANYQYFPTVLHSI